MCTFAPTSIQRRRSRCAADRPHAEGSPRRRSTACDAARRYRSELRGGHGRSSARVDPHNATRTCDEFLRSTAAGAQVSRRTRIAVRRDTLRGRVRGRAGFDRGTGTLRRRCIWCRPGDRTGCAPADALPAESVRRRSRSLLPVGLGNRLARRDTGRVRRDDRIYLPGPRSGQPRC